MMASICCLLQEGAGRVVGTAQIEQARLVGDGVEDGVDTVRERVRLQRNLDERGAGVSGSQRVDGEGRRAEDDLVGGLVTEREQRARDHLQHVTAAVAGHEVVRREPAPVQVGKALAQCVVRVGRVVAQPEGDRLHGSGHDWRSSPAGSRWTTSCRQSRRRLRQTVALGARGDSRPERPSVWIAVGQSWNAVAPRWVG